MAQSSDPLDSVRDRVGDPEELLAAWYHIPALLFLMGFMFWTRRLSVDRFRLPGDNFVLAGIDSNYHWRSTMYTVENWPNTMPYDVFTSFPTGQRVGQFGTAFDQIIATVALIVGLGDPSEALVHEVILFAIPAMAALVAIPVFLIGRRLGGRLAGLVAVLLLALFPGSFFFRSSVGQHQHHVAEVLFMAIAIFAFMVALRNAEREKPVYEQVLDRDVKGLRSTIVYSAVAGIALALYMLMWPPGVLLVGIVGVFFVVYLSITYVMGTSPEHLSFVGVISMVTTAIVWLGQLEEFSTSVTAMGYLPIALSLGVAAGCVFMAALGRYWDRSEMSRSLYPGAVAGSVILALGFMWLVLPDLFSTILSNVQGRLTPIGAGITAEVVQEARPPDNFSDHVFDEFGLAFYTMIVGLVVMVIAPLFGRRMRAEYALVGIWALFLISMTSAQVRFTYYLALGVAVMNAYLLGLVFDWADLTKGFDVVKSIEGYQIAVVATVLMILVVPLMPPVAATTVVDVGAGQGAHPDTVKWQDSLDYLETSTPVPGEFGGEDNALDYYGTYERPPNGDFDYPAGAYGVMTWWDYGHMVTVDGERIPHSNPFQRNARSSAAYLLSQGEQLSTLMLDALPTDVNILEASESELEDAVADRSEQEHLEQTRYVMIDDSMVGGKFGAISAWANEDFEDFEEFEEVTLGDNETANLPHMSDAYYNTTQAKLYLDDADGMEHYRLVHESMQPSIITSIAMQNEEGQWVPVARNADFSGAELHQVIAQVQTEPRLEMYETREMASVKTFEYVEGATMTGQTQFENATTVDIAIDMNVTNTDRQFEYTQTVDVDDDGSFEITVPYATHYDRGLEQGYTDSEVIADTNYGLVVSDENRSPLEYAEVTVNESAVYDGDEVPIDLEVYDPDNGEENNESNDTNGDNGDETDGADDDESTDDEDNDENTAEAIPRSVGFSAPVA